MSLHKVAQSGSSNPFSIQQRLARRLAWLQANHLLVFATLAMFGVRLIWAANIPLGNDEVYYWDWGRRLQMSYLDHPPGVAWLAYFSQNIGLHGVLAARFVFPFVHLLGAIIIGILARFLAGRPLTSSEKVTWFIVTQWIPAFSLGGFMLMPDSGLLFALSLVALQGVRVITRRRTLRVDDGLVLGAAYGLAGLFKYMALPIALGGVAAIFLSRRSSFKKEIGFWLGLVGAGILVVLPVFSWNSSHHWASFRFQTAHGFADSSFGVLPAARFWIGVLLFASPWLIWQGILEGVRFSGIPSATSTGLAEERVGERRLGGVFLLWSAFPLAAILFVQSWFKQLLPHWIIPSLWMLLPLIIAAKASGDSIRRKRVIAFGLVFFVAASILADARLRRAIVRRLNDQPGAFSELVLWQPLVDQLQETLKPDSVVSIPKSTLDCADGKKVLASLRWYWAAHLSFAFPGQPEVISLDMNHPSFYHQRNDLRELEGCYLVVVADERHLDREILDALMDVRSEESLRIAGFGDVPVKVFSGYLRAQRAQERYPLVSGI